MLEMMIDWLDTKIELNNKMIEENREISDFDLFLMTDVEMMEKIKQELSEILKNK